MKNNPTAPSGHVGSSDSSAIGTFDRDEAFWQKIRMLPAEVKHSPAIHEMLVFKSQIEMLNRDIEDAIWLRLAGWSASLPSGPLDVQRVFAWQWLRPGPRGGRLFLSTNQAITALRKEGAPPALMRLQEPLNGLQAENAVKIGGGAPSLPNPEVRHGGANDGKF
jgi:hypothetical protein